MLSKTGSDVLAINGGESVIPETAWKTWPIVTDEMVNSLAAVARSGRWTVSWPSSGEIAREREFAERFADYVDADYCVAVDHGSSALVVALSALGIGYGDRVIVPAMTWVATASSVLRVGAIPVLADVDPVSGCLTWDSIAAALDPATKAVIVVHLACTVADMDSIVRGADAAGILIIEDCAQSHGATYSGRKVGTFGQCAAFSFQQGKVLPAGEGGAITTSDVDIFHRAQSLRADGRRYVAVDQLRQGGFTKEIVPSGDLMGVNYCLSEFSAAVLLEGLKLLDDQHRVRANALEELEQAILSEIPGMTVVPLPNSRSTRSIYELGIFVSPEVFPGCTIDQVCMALSAEMSRPVYPPDIPLYRSPYFAPDTNSSFRSLGYLEANSEYPGAELYRGNTILLHHSFLLSDQATIGQLIPSLKKLSNCIRQVRELEPAPGDFIA